MVKREYEIELPKEVSMVLNLLQQYGEGYVVGGATRDILLGIEPKDYDFCTNLEYSKLLEIFKEFNPKEIGAHFGIIQIKVGEHYFEIAKLRKDVGVAEDRREQEVEFTSSLEEDLKRRDFSVNALAYDGNVIIALNEEAFMDIEEKFLCFVGDVEDRIKEDPLRAFRYVRIAMTKDLHPFESNVKVRKLLDKNPQLIESLSKERIRDEFVKILLSDKPSNGLLYLSELGLMKSIIPSWDTMNMGQHNPHHDNSVKIHTHRVVRACKPILELRLSALLHDIAKPKCFTMENGVGHFYGHDKEGEIMAREILTNLKFDSKTIDTVCTLVANHMNKSHRQTPKAMRKLINKVGVDNMPLLFQLYEADIIGSKPPYNFELLDNMKIMFHEITKENEESPCLKITDLKVNGHDLMKLGHKGKEIGDKLKELHEMVLENGAKFNTYENLIKFC